MLFRQVIPFGLEDDDDDDAGTDEGLLFGDLLTAAEVFIIHLAGAALPPKGLNVNWLDPRFGGKRKNLLAAAQRGDTYLASTDQQKFPDIPFANGKIQWPRRL